MKTITKTFSYCLKPTPEQIKAFELYASAGRYVFNWALGNYKINLEKKEKIGSFYHHYANQLKALKRQEATTWLSGAPHQVMQQSLIDLDRSLKIFFKMKKKGELWGFPHFKKRGVRDSFRCAQSVSIRGSYIKLPKLGYVAFIQHRPFEGEIKQTTVKKVGKRWMVNLVSHVQVPLPEPVENPQEVVINHVATDALVARAGDHSFEYKAPKPLESQLKSLAFLNRQVIRKAKDSKRFKKAVMRLGLLHLKMQRQRKDFNHKLSTQLIHDYDRIIVDTITIKSVADRKKADAAWGKVIEYLTYKASWYGKELIISVPEKKKRMRKIKPPELLQADTTQSQATKGQIS